MYKNISEKLSQNVCEFAAILLRYSKTVLLEKLFLKLTGSFQNL